MAKINLIIKTFLRRISEIKLKRTDTTLDLSQKAIDMLTRFHIKSVRKRTKEKLKEKEEGRWSRLIL